MLGEHFEILIILLVLILLSEKAPYPCHNDHLISKKSINLGYCQLLIQTVYMHICRHTKGHTHIAYVCANAQVICTHTYTCTHEHTHACPHTPIHTYAHMHTFMRITAPVLD
uniref:Secreted protein n=1 Tax=Anguilla anguilla TaxID=7936 RepID=A0A0E9X1C9_ANGAN